MACMAQMTLRLSGLGARLVSPLGLEWGVSRILKTRAQISEYCKGP